MGSQLNDYLSCCDCEEIIDNEYKCCDICYEFSCCGEELNNGEYYCRYHIDKYLSDCFCSDCHICDYVDDIYDDCNKCCLRFCNKCLNNGICKNCEMKEKSLLCLIQSIKDLIFYLRYE